VLLTSIKTESLKTVFRFCEVYSRIAGEKHLASIGEGRILLPAEARKIVKAHRFELKVEKGRIELLPLPDPTSVKRKYKDITKMKWEDLEEKAEQLVAEGRR